MKKIHKYSLELEDIQTVELPYGAEILHVDEQKGELKLWAMHEEYEPDTELAKEKRDIRIHGTGHQIPDEDGKRLVHIGTLKCQADSLIWHVFESITDEDMTYHESE